MIESPNPILECWLNDQFDLGIKTFEALVVVQPEDLLWVGQCYFGLDQNIEALGYFYRAYAGGLVVGQIFAATVLRFSSSLNMASQTLQMLNPAELPIFGQSAWYREHGLQLLAQRQVAQAVFALERAWQLACMDQLGQRLLPRYTQSLALALLESGQDARALQYLKHGAIPANSGIMLLQAAALAYTGELSQAQTVLAQIKDPSSRSQLIYGFIARTLGQIEQAAINYLEAASSAKVLGEWETEFYAELALCGLLAEQGELLVAQAHLSRARGLIQQGNQSQAVYEAVLAVRQAALLTRQGKEAIGLLQNSIFIFEQHGLERDIGIALLHLSEAYFYANQQQAGLMTLARAVNIRHALGSMAYFAVELRCLPHVFGVVCSSKQRGTEILRQDWLALEQQSPYEVQLCTLGDYAIRYNGQNVKLEAGTVKAVEFLAFLLEQGESKLETIIEELFEAGSHATARNRIHKLRESIARQVPGLNVPHSKDRNTYKIEPLQIRLRWDVREVRQALIQGGHNGLQRALAHYTGAFLPRSETEWANQKRFELEFDLARVGVEALQELFELERFEDCLRLAERLAEVSILNLGVQLMLVKATTRVHGAIAGRERLLKVDPLIQQDLRAMPELQQELRGMEHEFVN